MDARGRITLAIFTLAVAAFLGWHHLVRSIDTQINEAIAAGGPLVSSTVAIVERAPTPPQATSSLSVVPPKRSVKKNYFTVKRIIDGDTIELANGQKVRYIGVNSPESVDPRKPVQCFGKQAAAKNKELVLGRQVHLVKDVSETDKYKRLLRYVYLEDGTFINELLVREGYAQIMTIPPDVRWAERFRTAQREAREDKRGLWGKCK